MTRYVAFLRAINVAGHARVEMSRLCEAFARAGCRKRPVRTFKAANVIFETDEEDCAELFQKIRTKVCGLTGEQSSVIFRSARQIHALVKAVTLQGVRGEIAR